MHKISNKNVVNVIINNTKTKRKTRSFNNGSTLPKSNEMPMYNTINLQHELLRQSLNPQINRPIVEQNKFRNQLDNNDGLINEGNPNPDVQVDDIEPDLQSSISDVSLIERPKKIKIRPFAEHVDVAVPDAVPAIKASKLTEKSLGNMSLKRLKALALNEGVDKSFFNGINNKNKKHYAHLLYGVLNPEEEPVRVSGGGKSGK